jgi:hypothetical protein
MGGATAGSGGATAGTGGATAGSGGARAGARGGNVAGTGGGGVAGAAGGASGRGGGAAAGGGGGAATSTLKLEYSTTSASAANFDVRITNLGPGTPLIAGIKFRYYFVDESGGTTTTVIDAARWTIASPPTTIDVRSGGCTVTVTIRISPASSYTDVGCNFASPMAANDFLSFTVHDNAPQNPTNDYSYIATGGALTVNGHMLVLLNGTVVWGTAP